MKFTKVHGLGNDFVVIDAVGEPALASSPDLGALAASACCRRTAVGADGLILITRPDDHQANPDAADVRMRIFNADGAEAEMCGNGLRCVAKLAWERGYGGEQGDVVRILTARGVLPVRVALAPDGRVQSAAVDMGPPILEPAAIPLLPDRLDAWDAAREEGALAGLCARFVSMGNPHCVLFAEQPVDAIALESLGPLIERHEAFPARINVHIVNVLSRTEARMRTWERGAGLTAACGTGACAVVVAGSLAGLLDRAGVTLHLPGGELNVRWDAATGHVIKTGPAAEVYSGEWLAAPRDTPEHAAIATERLFLTPVARADAPEIQRLCEADESIARNTLTIPWPYPRGEALVFIERVRADAARGVVYAIRLRDGGALVGTCGVIRHRAGWTCAELGYWVAAEHRGRGYAPEAARALADHTLRAMDLDRVFARVFPANPASMRVLEKAGFERVAVLKGQLRKDGKPQDVVEYALSRSR